MYVQPRSRNLYCCGSAKIITHSRCASDVLVIQHEMRMRPNVICGPYLSLYSILPRISQTVEFWTKNNVIEHKIYVLIFSADLKHLLCLEYFSEILL
jgi:hypothetical protein